MRLTPIVRAEASFQTALMHLDMGGEVGFHEATVPRLFLVVAGEGWVCGVDQVRQPISVGTGAYWEAGESHGAGTASEMTALVVESDALDPESWTEEEAETEE